jgi:Domain of unknown function (DUF3850)
MTIHVVKSWPQFFSQLSAGARMHELRRNDRNYIEGDVLELREYDPNTREYTGRVCVVQITSITSAQQPCAVSTEGLHPDFCILSVRQKDNPSLGPEVDEASSSENSAMPEAEI